MRSDIGECIFQRAYFLYKRYEARGVARLRPYVDDNAWIFDVGANIGFLTMVFARWLDAGKVLALEPEPKNFARLQQNIWARSLAERVDARQLAAAEHKGIGHLVVSEQSPADHRLGDKGLSVPIETLDDIWHELGRPQVCLVKIDVQGAEARVLAGAHRLLSACRPALYIEIDADPSHVPSGHAQSLLAALDALGYRPHTWRNGWIPLTAADALAEAVHAPSNYKDFLFLPQ